MQITLANVNLKYKIKNQTHFSLLKYNYFIFDETFLSFNSALGEFVRFF